MSFSELLDSVSDLVVGIDQFELGDEVQASSVEVQYEAVDKRTGANVLVKVHDFTSGDPDDRKRLVHEIQFLREKPPLTMEMVGYGLIADSGATKFFMALKPSSYGTLHIMLKGEMAGRVLDGWDATSKSKCVFGTAAAMCVVHSRNYLHRNLTPAAVQLDEHLEPVLGEFDLTRQDDTNVKMSAWPLFCMAPEMWRGDNQYDSKVDVFAFAIVLHNFFTGTESISLDDDPKWPVTIDEFMARVGSGARLARVEEIPDFYWALITSRPRDAPFIPGDCCPAS